MSPVAITGAAGFIGSRLCERLAAGGRSIVAIDDLSLGREEHLAGVLARGRTVFERLDVAAEPAALRDLLRTHAVETVWHLAANSDIAAGSRDREIDLRRTFLSTWAALEAAAAAGVREFLFASTSAVFGDTARPLGEEDGPLEPISYYGAAKLAAEAWVSAYAHRAGFRAWTFRFPNVVGTPATHGVILDFVRKVRDTGRLDVLGDGSQTKPYLHVEDLIDGMLAGSRDHTRPVNVFHLAGDGRTTVRDIARLVAEAMELPADRVRFGSGDRGWPGDVPRFEYDGSRIRALGWRPRLDSDAAVRRAIQEVVAQEAACARR